VEVDHGGGYVGMAEEVLDGAYVDAAFEEVGGGTRVVEDFGKQAFPVNPANPVILSKLLQPLDPGFTWKRF